MVQREIRTANFWSDLGRSFHLATTVLRKFPEQNCKQRAIDPHNLTKFHKTGSLSDPTLMGGGYWSMKLNINHEYTCWSFKTEKSNHD